MNLGFKQKLQLISLILLVVVITQSVFILVSQNNIRKNSVELVEKEMAILNLAHELKLSVVQVQQWLTDISATRALDGLNDGFDEAQNNAELFHSFIERLKALDTDNTEIYLQMIPVFDQYFSVGKQMAQAYIDSGPAGGNKMMANFDEAAASMSEQVDGFLQETIARSQNKGKNELSAIERLSTITVIATVVLIGSILFAIWQGNLLLKYLGHDPEVLQSVATNISSGDLSPHADESQATGVFASLSTMRIRLAEQLDSIQRQAMENGRIKTALDNVTSNVMVADNDRNIIYCNKSVLEMFQNAEADIRNAIPGFDASKLLNTNIDEFHKNPKHQADLLATFTSTYSSELGIGGRTMRVTANPVIDESGTRLGSVVEWADRTAEVAIEHEIENLVSAAQKGNLDTRLSLEGKSGFTATLAENLNEMLNVLSSTFEDVNSVMSTLADGDLTHSITRDYEGIFGEAKGNINSTITHLSEIVSEIRSATNEIVGGSEEISTGNNSLSARTEQQASALEETAASMEELTSTVDQNSNNAQEADKLASNAVQIAREGGDVITNAVSAMSAITKSSNQITEIIGVIDEIAFQTNLLALNASVEAARAGEQGRGFAVVASEVRNLAQRSATAAKEIKDLIQDSASKVQSGSKLVNQSGESLQSIVEGVQKVGDIIKEIATAGKEQSEGISQVMVTVHSLDSMTQQNAALAEETSAASVSMNERALAMSKSIEFFKL